MHSVKNISFQRPGEENSPRGRERSWNSTDKKKFEIEKADLEARLLRAQKLESLGILTRGIAHDFNNILTSIIAYTQLLEMQDFPDEAYVRNSLHQILESAYQARDLVKQIMIFGRQAEYAKEPVLLDHVVRDVVNMIRSSLPSIIDIREEVRGKNYIVFAYPSQMRQVLMNLCTNAAHAMGSRGGILKIKLDRVTLNKKRCQIIESLTPGKYVEITVSDTGSGIAPEHIPHIFDPYFTTKKTEEGTGLGLFISLGIIKKHDGAILVKSDSGHGSTFTVLIPYF